MPIIRRPSPTSSSSFADSSVGRQCTIVKEGHGRPIYCVAFSRHLYARSSRTALTDDGDAAASSSAIFATCGGTYATIYEITCSTNNQKKNDESSSSSELSARQIYRDVDEGETFYTCAFGGRGVGISLCVPPASGTTNTSSNGIANFGTQQQQQQSSDYDNQHQHQQSMKRQRRNDNPMNGPPLLCLGGTRGIIKIIDTTTHRLHITLSGHGNDITDLKFSPTNEFLLLSASKDESIRVWNISSQHHHGNGGVNVAIFAGHVGHRGQVLSIGWHASGTKFVSAGMDNMIKLWNIDDNMTTTTTKAIANSCSNRNNNNNDNNNNATTTTTDNENVRRGGVTVEMALCKSQYVLPSNNWSNEKVDGCSSRSRSERISSPIQQQYSQQERDDQTTFDTVFQQFPYFSTNKVHTSYVGKCYCYK